MVQSLNVPLDMGLFTRILLFTYLLGAVFLNSCHPVHPESKSVSMGTRVDGLRLYSEGPNCWNGALLKAGLAQSVRFVPKGEYWFWMNSKYCRPLGPKDKPKSGDLGSLFWKDQGHYHSFVYLDNSWVFSKNSPDPKHEYKVQLFEEMFFMDQRKLAKQCWHQGNPTKDSKCDFLTVFHRCKPLENNFFQKGRHISQWDRRIRPLEEQVFLWTTGKSKMSMTEMSMTTMSMTTMSMTKYEATVKKLYRILREIQTTQKAKLRSRDLFKLEALEFRVIGLILADVKVATMIPKLYPLINYAYRSQAQKKGTVPLAALKPPGRFY
jgi:hypothetical protein